MGCNHKSLAMQQHEAPNCQYLTFDLLSHADVPHAVFLRGTDFDPQGTDFLHSLNLANEVMGGGTIAWAHQVHGNQVIAVDATWNKPIEADGLMSNCKAITLMVRHADCQAALFYDPINGAIAAVHSGWRGTVQNIYASCVSAMQASYGSSPADLLVCIGPSLGPQAAEFVNYATELPKSFLDFQVAPCHFDFWEISRQQLLACGVLPQHIEIAKLCTHSDPKDYFSYRRDRCSGRHGTLIRLACRS